LVDEHLHDALFLSLVENRYLGGLNTFTLNIDDALPNPGCWLMIASW
jgi:hypothetical protein